MRYNHLALSVKDLERSVEFYQEVFGFVETKRLTREDLRINIALLKLNTEEEMLLELIQPHNPIKNQDDPFNLNILGLKHICFEVENVEEEYQELRSKGYEVTKPKTGKSIKKYFFVKDPDGLMMELCER
ncbi:MAG: VOC family protein [bacterium]